MASDRQDTPGSEATGDFRPEDLAPQPAGPSGPVVPDSGATGDFRPQDLGQAVRDSSVPEATGDFRPDNLVPPSPAQTGNGAPDAGATGEFRPQDLGQVPMTPPVGPVDAGATGEFRPQDLASAPPGMDAPESGATGDFRPQDLADGGRPADAGATGDFHAADLAPVATPTGTCHGEKPGQQTGHGAGRMTSPAAPGAYPPQMPQVRSGRYALKRFHAQGGMGEVWLAEDCEINRPVALKKIRSGRSNLRERFLLEAQITGQLEHPGVVPVHELGADENGEPFYVMRFIQGRTLEDVIEKYHGTDAGEVPREVQHLRLLQVFINLCQTVAYAHNRGVIHRDLKPDNVMVGEYGETLVLDWGLAKVQGQEEEETDLPRFVHLSNSGSSTETEAGSVKGTPGYMAPEVASGLIHLVDERSDIYLLGATLYHILSGHAPRKGANLVTVITEARTQAPPSPRALNRSVPRPLEAICVKAMAFIREHRYPTASALAEDVQRYLAGEPVSAYRENLLERTWRWAKRHRQLLGWCGATVLVLATALFGVVRLREVERQREEERIEAARQLKIEEEEKLLARRKAAFLEQQKEARRRLVEFRRLGDQMRFYAASPDPFGEQAQAFYDLESGEGRGRAALALVKDWGPTLENLPLVDERAPVKKELYDLILLMAQVRRRRASASDAAAGRDMVALLDQARPLQPLSVGYHRLRGDGYRLLGEKEKAAEEQRLAEARGTPTTAQDHYLQGVQLQAEATRPADARAEGEAGKKAREQLARKAIEQYRLALQSSPAHYWAHLQLGSTYLALGQRAEAAEALNACVALSPDSPWGYVVRGLALVGLGRHSEAVVDLDHAIRLSPDFRLPRLNRGIALWLQKKPDEAIADFNAVLQPPESQRLIEAAYYRGQVHLERERYKEALADFNLVVAAKRSFPSLHLFRARVLLCLKDQPRALAALDDFLAGSKPLDPESAEAYGRRGGLLRRVLYPDLPGAAGGQAIVLARAQLEEAVKRGARSVEVFDDLGATREMLGEVDLAIEANTKALELDPNNVTVRVRRGWAYAGLRVPQYDRAREDFAAVVAKHPTHAEALAGLGYVEASRKAPGEARVAAGRALLNGGGDYLVLHNVACVYGRLSVTDPARVKEYQDLAIDHLRRALELYRRKGSGPNEVDLIKAEPAFPPALRNRKEFQDLLTPAAP
jgi:tetratricopeptide (TPR) repeat protein/tRNA A-37 threonylcarbamoyl transferase component Bud32